MVYSTDRSKAVVPVLAFHFVTLWFILRGNLFHVLPCVLVFFSPFSIAVTSLREERANLSAFRTFVLLVLVSFLFLLVSGKGCGLWLWHSLDFSLTLFALCYFVLVFFSPFSIAITSLVEERELIFVRSFDLHLFGFVCFLILLASGKGCDLWLWHYLDLSLTFFESILFVHCRHTMVYGQNEECTWPPK